MHNGKKKLVNSIIKSGVFCFAIVFILFTEPLLAGPPDDINVEEIQSKLNELCFDAGPIDGVWGKKTEAAVNSYFDAAGKKYSGVLTKQFLNEMKNGKTSNCRAGFSNALIYYDDFSSKLNPKYMRNQIPDCIGNCENYNAIEYEFEGNDRYISLSSKQGQMSVRNVGDQIWNKDRIKLAIELPFRGKDIKNKHIYYGFKAKFPKGVKSINAQNVTFTELHQIEKSEGNKIFCTKGMFWRINYENNLQTWLAVTAGSGQVSQKQKFGYPILSDTWSTFKIGMYFHRKNGFVILERNGKEIYRYKGDTYNILWSGNEACTGGEPLRYLLQLGVYRGIKYSFTPADYDKKIDTIHFDDFIISQEERDIDLVLQ